MSQLMQRELKKMLHYDPTTGVFTWLVTRGPSRKGTIAGHFGQSGYIQIGVCGKVYQAHRLVFLYMTDAFPLDQVDHINRVRNDNRWLNLRQASGFDNAKNRSLDCLNKSGAKGVCWKKECQKWVAQIRHSWKKWHLGYYSTIAEASAAYAIASAKYHGIYGATK